MIRDGFVCGCVGIEVLFENEDIVAVTKPEGGAGTPGPGGVAYDRGTIAKPLRRFGSGRVGINPQHGRSSLTEYLVLRRFEAHTLVEAYPKRSEERRVGQ